MVSHGKICKVQRQQKTALSFFHSFVATSPMFGGREVEDKPYEDALQYLVDAEGPYRKN